MDLEEYRRAYMRAEGIGNTPINTIRRAARLGKSIAKMSSSIRQDKYEKAERKDARHEAMEYIKENGISGASALALMHNRPRVGSNTAKNVEQIGDSAVAMERSLNEFGQTAASIAGAKRSDTYDSQDLEKGISFAITGTNIIRKGIKSPSKVINGAESLACLSYSIFHINKDILDKTTSKAQDKERMPRDRVNEEPER